MKDDEGTLITDKEEVINEFKKVCRKNIEYVNSNRNER
jgi:hypothetical protein